ncbi:GntR family transcriptional regulator [Pengzhenrongella sicca]|uniref:GntR family transcriptional regulator n=1 Tax=Pengzhenrongella sicca TaxID=2819238 RepID=A0A8A4ZG79_9MICO|nr:GntR family transcriptional regulator [Pengzhenrongella sicca]QTE30904.1 GntR family transcriptional regulator [Pengzhenrongella sicca]
MSAPVDELCERVRALIRHDEVRPGDRIGDERSIATSLGVPRSRLRQALDLLEAEGVVRRRIGRGGGIVASDGRLERNLSTIEGLPVIARQQGIRLETRVLRAEVALASGQDQRLLDLTPHDYVYRLLRLRLADGHPLSLEASRLPTATFPGLLLQDLSSLYALLGAHYGVTPAVSDETLELVLADDERAGFLEVAAGTPLIYVHRTTADAAGRPIEIGREYFIGTRVRFHLRNYGFVRHPPRDGGTAG